MQQFEYIVCSDRIQCSQRPGTYLLELPALEKQLHANSNLPVDLLQINPSCLVPGLAGIAEVARGVRQPKILIGPRQKGCAGHQGEKLAGVLAVQIRRKFDLTDQIQTRENLIQMA
jgi:hypothetical protein